MANRQLILLRHAKSDWYSGACGDFDRPLNKRGRRDAPKVGAWLEENGYRPQRILCSSASRTRETCLLLCRAAGWDQADVNFSDELYLADSHKIRKMIDVYLRDYSRLMVIGHNPGIESALMEFCPQIQTPDDGKIMATATLAVIGFKSGRIGPGNGECLCFKRPSQLG